MREFRMQIHRIVSPGSRGWSSLLPQPPGKLQSLGQGRRSCSFTAWSASRGCHAAGKVLAFHNQETAAGMEGEISCALSSILHFSGSLQTPPKTQANHQAKSSRHPTAAFAFTKPRLAASPIVFSLSCTDVVLRDYAVD